MSKRKPPNTLHQSTSSPAGYHFRGQCVSLLPMLAGVLLKTQRSHNRNHNSMKIDSKQWLPHLIALAVFVLTLVYAYSPTFSGKVLPQSDIVQHQAMAKELRDFKQQTGQSTQWSNSMFGGMPTYQLENIQEGNLLSQAKRFFQGFLPHPASMFFSAMLCAYLMLILLGVNPWLSIIGALAFGFATNNVILFEAGHNNKVRALAYFPLIIAGIVLAFRSKYVLGGLIFALGMGLAILSNHPQMVYYLGLTIPIFGIAALVEAARTKGWSNFLKAAAALVIGLLLAVGSGASNLLPTSEYTADTMRGQPILESSGTPSSSSETDGLEWNYAMNWSNGTVDLLATFIPRAAGGGSSERISRDTPFGKAFGRLGARLPQEFDMRLYFGNLPFTSGPIYLGALVWFLFVLGILLTKGPVRAWLLGGTILTFMLSMGSELEWFNRALYDHLPLFNKFRSPSSTLSVTIILMVGLGVLGLQRFYELLSEDKNKAQKNLFLAGGVTAGFGVLMALLGPGLIDMNAANDMATLQSLTGGQVDQNGLSSLASALVETRASLLRADAFRSLLFVALGFGVLYLWLKDKLSIILAAGALALLAFVDFYQINSRYIDKKDFVAERQYQQSFQPSSADQQILSDTDPNFRVFDNTSGDPFQNAAPSYHHKSVGGYHAAKLQRYQDLIDRHLTKGNQRVYDMLNTKYFIANGQNGPQAQRNPNALGNAWLVKDIRLVSSNNEEIDALNSIQPDSTAVVHQEFTSSIEGLRPNGQGSIQLTSYQPNKLEYNYNSSNEQLAVFSEIWYGPNKGWKVAIDDQPAELIRANYVLRALRLPAGQHKISMYFEPDTYQRGVTISLISSLLILLGLLAYLVMGWKKREKQTA